MRILVIGGTVGSLVNFRGDLLRDLMLAGCEIHAAAPDAEPRSFHRLQLESIGVSVSQFSLSRRGLNPVSDLGTLRSLFRLIRRVNPDCLLAYTIKPVIFGIIAACFARVPRRVAMITGIGFAMQGSGSRRMLRLMVEMLYRIALTGADCVLFQNPDDAELFRRRRLLWSSAEIRVVNGSGVSLDRFPKMPMPKGRFRFLMISRLLADKGVAEYLSAARSVKQDFPDTEFVLIGSSEAGPNAIPKELLKTAIDDGIVQHIAHTDEIVSELSLCTVFVLPSYREGTPRSVLEALSVGRPVITTDVPGCRQTVVPGVNGILVEARSASALASGMVQMIHEQHRLSAMADRSRELAETHFDVRKINFDIMKSLIGSRDHALWQ